MQRNIVSTKMSFMLEAPQNRTNDTQLFLTAKEVAERLRLSIKSVYRMVSEGTGPPVKRLGKKYGYRFPRKKFEAWAEKTTEDK